MPSHTDSLRSFRQATLADITQMQIVRNAVRENILSDPALIPDKAYEEYLIFRGKGWVCEADNTIAGFAIVDLKEHNVWALFVNLAHEAKGIGKALHNIMLDWYFMQTDEPLWLGTAPGTRAETFYKMLRWQETGMYGTKEVRFEMSAAAWRANRDVKT